MDTVASWGDEWNRPVARRDARLRHIGKPAGREKAGNRAPLTMGSGGLPALAPFPWPVTLPDNFANSVNLRGSAAFGYPAIYAGAAAPLQSSKGLPEFRDLDI